MSSAEHAPEVALYEGAGGDVHPCINIARCMAKIKLATECGVVCGDNSEAKVVLGTAIQRLKS